MLTENNRGQERAPEELHDSDKIILSMFFFVLPKATTILYFKNE